MLATACEARFPAKIFRLNGRDIKKAFFFGGAEPSSTAFPSIWLRICVIFPCWFQMESITTGNMLVFPGDLSKWRFQEEHLAAKGVSSRNPLVDRSDLLRSLSHHTCCMFEWEQIRVVLKLGDLKNACYSFGFHQTRPDTHFSLLGPGYDFHKSLVVPKWLMSTPTSKAPLPTKQRPAIFGASPPKTCRGTATRVFFQPPSPWR